MERISGVYTITCKVNGRRYVGESGNVYNRWKAHRSWLNLGQHPVAKLQADWTEYGHSAFEFRVVAKIADPDVRFTTEQALIGSYGSVEHGYNLASGGRASSGTHISDEHKMAISAANKDVPKSDDHRAKLSAAQKAHWEATEITPEIRERMADLARRRKGQPKSAEARQHMSEAQKGKTLSPEHLANLRAAKKGVRGPGAKLDEAKVREIKRRLADGASCAGLGREFGVSPLTISDVKHGRTWRDVTI